MPYVECRCAALVHLNKIQIIQKKVLSIIAGGPYFVTNVQIYREIQIHKILKFDRYGRKAFLLHIVTKTFNYIMKCSSTFPIIDVPAAAVHGQLNSWKWTNKTLNHLFLENYNTIPSVKMNASVQKNDERPQIDRVSMLYKFFLRFSIYFSVYLPKYEC